MIRHTRLLLWRLFAAAMVALAMAGAVMPVLPTVPFLLVAAWAASRGWPSLEARLLAHPKHGPHIRRWRERGAVPRRAKWFSSLMMTASAAMLLLSTAPLWVKWAAPAMMASVAVWLWRRPED
ncbi:YbaN family protein [Burkholderiaceae bacterium FT117]|uniref:YbaN family protein n=1 Tax=Zeimonas sediminis TaxID=2944268 RepID=UPI0023430004|nr:YbaN family protein [Zeimonas sediminis]MCM5570155.1 YbaN family protein [Zeimonas sediminis]